MFMEKIIPIFYTIDDKFAPFLAVSIKSLLDNASKEYEYHIYVINEGLSEENKNKIKKLETVNSKIIFSEMKEDLSCITDRVENRLRADYLTLSIYFRIFLPVMFKQFDKAIYIDADTCVVGDISEMYNQKLENNLIGACIDESIQGIKPMEEYIEKAVGIPSNRYLNSGVLLLNMKELRNVKIDEKFLYLFNTYHFANVDPDQSYINALCYGKILYMDGKWDTMPNNKTNMIDNPGIIHYNLFSKPWNYDNIQYEEYFWKYARLTEYYDDIKYIKNHYSSDDKKKDSDTLNFMIKRCEEIVTYNNNFRDIFESGKESRL